MFLLYLVMFVLYPLLAAVDLTFTFISLIFINWWAPAFAKDGVAYDRGEAFPGPVLPNWLKWFDTFDANLDVAAPNGVGTYWTRVKWLYRNHGYGFSYWVLGMKFDPIQWKVKSYSVVDGKHFFFAVGPHGTFNLNTIRFGLQFKIGWKSWNYYIPDDPKIWNDKPWGPEMRIPLVFSISLAK